MNSMLDVEIFDVKKNAYKIKSVYKESFDSTFYLTYNQKIIKLFKDSEDKNLRKRLRAISIHNVPTDSNIDMDSDDKKTPTYYYKNIALPEVLLKEPYIGYVIDCDGFNKNIANINEEGISFVDKLRLSINLVESLIEFGKDGFVLNNLNPAFILFNDNFEIKIIDCDSLTQGAYVSSISETEYHDPYVLNYLMTPSTLTDTYSVYIIVFELLYGYPFGDKGEYLAKKGQVDFIGFDSLTNCIDGLKELFCKMFVDCKNRYIDRPSLVNLLSELRNLYNSIVCCNHCGNEFCFVDELICPKCHNHCDNNFVLKLGKKIQTTNRIMPKVGLTQFETITVEEIKKVIISNRIKKVFASDFDELNHAEFGALMVIDNKKNSLSIQNVSEKEIKITNDLSSLKYDILEKNTNYIINFDNLILRKPIYIVVEESFTQQGDYGDIQIQKFVKLEG